MIEGGETLRTRFLIVLSALLALLVVCGLSYSAYAADRVGFRLAPLVDASMECRLKATRGHQLLEEVLDGDTYAEMGEVRRLLEESQWYVQAMLEGGANEQDSFPALVRPECRANAQRTQEALRRFRQEVELTYARRGQGDFLLVRRRHDAAFEAFRGLSVRGEQRIKAELREGTARLRVVHAGLLLSVLLLGSLTAWELRRSWRERALSMRALQEGEARYRAITGDLPAMVSRSLPSGVLTYANRSCADFIGRDPADLVGANYLDFLPAAERRALLADLAALTPERPVQAREQRFVLPGGEVRWQRWTNRALFDGEGTLLGYQSLGEDISERKQAEQALRESEVLLSDTSRIAKIGGWELDREDMLLSWTEGVGRVFELPAGEVPPLEDAIGYYHEEDRGALQEGIRLALEEGVPYDLELRLVTAKGRQIWTHSTCEPVLEKGKTVKLRGTVQDITARRKAQEELRSQREHLSELVAQRTGELDLRVHEAERLNSALLNLADDLRRANVKLAASGQRLREGNQELEAFAYSVSHDLRTPLRAIEGFGEILASRHRESLNEEGQRYFDLILKASQNMGALIEDLLRYARLGRRGVRLRPVRLKTLLERVLEDLAPRLEESGGHVEIPEDLPSVWADETLLTQIFSNLIDNALVYRKPGIPPQVTLSWRTEARHLVFSVSDQGIGIPVRHQEKIFTLFQRLHPDSEDTGQGIGLAIVRKAAGLLEGNVEVESAEGVGSTFHLRLSRKPAGLSGAHERQAFSSRDPDRGVS